MTKMTLYEIENAILDCIDGETGEIDAEKYEALSLAREQKIENTALLIKNLKAEYKCLKEEKASFDERMKRCEKQIESAEKRLSESLSGEAFKTTKVQISWRSSQKLVVDDLKEIPLEYLRYHEPEADKTAIKNAIKAGENISGVHMETSMNMTIK